MSPATICCCIPLKFGCFLVGIYNLLDFCVKLGSAVKFILPYLQHGSTGINEGDSLWLYLTVLQCGTQLSLGVCVLLGTALERQRLLRFCAASLLMLSFVSLVFGTAAAFSSKYPRIFLTYVVDFVLISFCSFVVSAYVGEIKDSVVPVRNEIT